MSGDCGVWSAECGVLYEVPVALATLIRRSRTRIGIVTDRALIAGGRGVRRLESRGTPEWVPSGECDLGNADFGECREVSWVVKEELLLHKRRCCDAPVEDLGSTISRSGFHRNNTTDRWGCGCWRTD